jgi:hypothetical protein
MNKGKWKDKGLCIKFNSKGREKKRKEKRKKMRGKNFSINREKECKTKKGEKIVKQKKKKRIVVVRIRSEMY